MNSMTGYGKGFAEADGRKITVEMKSVNSKNLDLNVRSPKALYFAEDAVRKTVKSFFIHGRIDVFITYENTSDDASGVMVNDALASEYVRIAEYLASEYNLVNDFSVSALMKSPDVISSVETEDDEDALEALVVAATKEAAKGMDEKRGREGLGLSLIHI